MELLPRYESSYFLIFGDIIILPHEKLKKIENSKAFDGADNTIIVLKNEKIAFIQNINVKGNEVKNHISVSSYSPNQSKRRES